jgi:hypothetical protein
LVASRPVERQFHRALIVNDRAQAGAARFDRGGISLHDYLLK